MSAARRQLRFDTLADAVRDAERLLASGYDRAGKWDLAQCCGHLANWLAYPVDGFPKAALPFRAVAWVMRNTMGRKMLDNFLANGMRPNMPTIPESVPPAGGGDAAGVERLKEAVRRFEAHEGDYLPSPLLGPLTRDESLRVQLGHMAHHLSFLSPKQ